MKQILIATLFLSACKVFSQNISPDEIIQEADLLINNYQFGQALSLLNTSVDSMNISLLQRKGFCYSRLGNYSDAIIAYESIRETDSLNRDDLNQLGQLYSRNDQYGEARVCYQKLIDLDSTNSFYYKQYASVSVKANDIIKGIANYLQTVKLNPRDFEAYAELGNILLEAELYQFADSILTRALDTAENSQLRLLLARAKFGEEEYEAVIENVEQLLIKSDTTPTYARLLGISYFQLDQYKKVIPCMQLLLRNGVKADWIFYYLGVSFHQLNDPKQGIIFLNNAIEESISDNISTYYTQLAMTYEEIKDYKNAIRYYRVAYESSKSDILLYHLARNYDVYYKDKTPALIYYKKYLNSDDTIQIAKEYSRHRLSVLSDFR